MPKTGESRFIPKTLPDFQKHSPNNEACIAYLSPRDSPLVFYAAIMDNTKIMQDYHTPLSTGPTVYRCRNCKRETRFSAGVIMHQSKQPLCSRF